MPLGMRMMGPAEGGIDGLKGEREELAADEDDMEEMADRVGEATAFRGGGQGPVGTYTPCKGLGSRVRSGPPGDEAPVSRTARGAQDTRACAAPAEGPSGSCSSLSRIGPGSGPEANAATAATAT